MKNLFVYELRKFFRQKSLYILLSSMTAFGMFVMMILNSVASADDLGQMGFGVLPINAITTFQAGFSRRFTLRAIFSARAR